MFFPNLDLKIKDMNMVKEYRGMYLLEGCLELWFLYFTLYNLSRIFVFGIQKYISCLDSVEYDCVVMFYKLPSCHQYSGLNTP